MTTSLADLVGHRERIVGKRAIIERLPAQPGDVPITCADIPRAQKLLGYRPSTRVADGFAQQWEWLKADRFRST